MFISPAPGDAESCLNIHWAKYRHFNSCYGNGEARGGVGIAGYPGDVGQNGLVLLVRSSFSGIFVLGFYIHFFQSCVRGCLVKLCALLP